MIVRESVKGIVDSIVPTGQSDALQVLPKPVGSSWLYEQPKIASCLSWHLGITTGLLQPWLKLVCPQLQKKSPPVICGVGGSENDQHRLHRTLYIDGGKPPSRSRFILHAILSGIITRGVTRILRNILSCVYLWNAVWCILCKLLRHQVAQVERPNLTGFWRFERFQRRYFRSCHRTVLLCFPRWCYTLRPIDSHEVIR